MDLHHLSFLKDVRPDTMRQLSIYDDQSLQPGQFRLLELLPSDSEKIIETHLFKASLVDPPLYDALSYRWEALTDRRIILINGAEVPVMNNLFTALQHMKRMAEGSNKPIRPMYLWVDSICINQSSNRDRTNQVSLMGQIYSKAWTVRIWIGNPGSTDVKAAFQLLRDCGGTPTHVHTMEAVRRVTSDMAGTKALTELLQRSYWDRMWVFQEIVLSRQATVHCGGYSVDWYYFTHLDRLVASRHLWNDAQLQHQQVLHLRKALFRIAHLSISREQACSVHNVLHPTRHLQCQDPRDKLYALLGVCNTLADTLRPDYTVPTREVYTAFFRDQMQSDGDLSALVTAGLWNPAYGDDIGLPSWVPDLRGVHGVDIRYLAGTFLEHFNATGSFEGDFRFLDQNGCSVLESPALFYDNIDIFENLERRNCADLRGSMGRFCRMDGSTSFSMNKLLGFFRAIIFEDASFFGHAGDKLIEKTVERGMYPEFQRKVSVELGGEIMSQDEVLAKTKQYVREIQKERMTRLILGFCLELQQHYQLQTEELANFFGSFQNLGIDLLKERRSSPLDLYSPEDLHLYWLEFLARAD